MNSTISHFTINILEPPAAGSRGILVRVKDHDLEDVNKACRMIGMTQAEFLRTTVIQAARQIIRELTAK